MPYHAPAIKDLRMNFQPLSSPFPVPSCRSQSKFSAIAVPWQMFWISSFLFNVYAVLARKESVCHDLISVTFHIKHMFVLCVIGLPSWSKVISIAPPNSVMQLLDSFSRDNSRLHETAHVA